MTQLTIAPPAGLNDDALYKSTFYLLTYLLTWCPVFTNVQNDTRVHGRSRPVNMGSVYRAYGKEGAWARYITLPVGPVPFIDGQDSLLFWKRYNDAYWVQFPIFVLTKYSQVQKSRITEHFLLYSSFSGYYLIDTYSMRLVYIFCQAAWFDNLYSLEW